MHVINPFSDKVQIQNDRSTGKQTFMMRLEGIYPTDGFSVLEWEFEIENAKCSICKQSHLYYEILNPQASTVSTSLPSYFFYPDAELVRYILNRMWLI